MADLRVALKGETNIGYIIAPPNASEEDKKKADLVLDDVNGSPHTQLADMVDMLHDRRGQNTDIAIVIEFCPGVIELPYDTSWTIPETKGNIYIYGNGVKIEGHREYENVLNISQCWLYDIIAENDISYSEGGTVLRVNNSKLFNCEMRGGSGIGIHATNSTLSNCSGSSDGYSDGILAENSTLSNCSGSGNFSYGITAYSSILTNCSGISDNDHGIYAYGSCTIQGCDGTEGGISVPSTGTYPQTLELLQQLNKGTITIRS